MQNYTEISTLRDFIFNEGVVLEKIPMEELFLETFLFDDLFSKSREQKLIESRIKYIQEDRQGKVSELEGIRAELEGVVSSAEEKLNGNMLLEVSEGVFIREMYIFKEIYGSLPLVFRKMKKVDLDSDWKNLEDLILSVKDFLFVALGKEIFRSENFSKSMIVANILLSVLKLPQINIYYRDRARVFRTLDSKMDFEKEFTLTVESFQHKNIASIVFPESKIGVEQLKKERGLADVYIPPGYSWYERSKDGDILKQTYRDYKEADVKILGKS